MARSRGFCFTDYTLDENFYDAIPADYLIIGREICPTTGRKHLQGYLYFKNQRTVSSIIKLLSPRHVECARGTPQENITYCSKGGDFIERGCRPLQGSRTDLLSVATGIKRDRLSLRDVMDQYPVEFVKYSKGLSALVDSAEERRTWITEVFLYWGDSETGKTRAAIEDGAVIVERDKSGFIHNYNGEDRVLFDDIDLDDFRDHRSWWLKILDRYPHTVNVKGGTRNWKPRRIYITSNDNPLHFITDPAIKRRITRIKHFTHVKEEPHEQEVIDVDREWDLVAQRPVQRLSEVSEVAGNTNQPLPRDAYLEFLQDTFPDAW